MCRLLIHLSLKVLAIFRVLAGLVDFYSRSFHHLKPPLFLQFSRARESGPPSVQTCLRANRGTPRGPPLARTGRQAHSHTGSAGDATQASARRRGPDTVTPSSPIRGNLTVSSWTYVAHILWPTPSPILEYLTVSSGPYVSIRGKPPTNLHLSYSWKIVYCVEAAVGKNPELIFKKWHCHQ